MAENTTNAFATLDDSVRQQNTFSSTFNPELQRQYNRDRITDTEGRNSALYEAVHNGIIDISTPARGSGDTGRNGHVNTEEDTVKIRTMVHQNNESKEIEFDVTKISAKLKEVYELFTLVTNKSNESFNDLVQKIADIRSANGQFSSEFINKFNEIHTNVQKLNEVINRINSTKIDVINKDEIAREATEACANVVNQVKDLNIQDFIQNEINNLLNQGIDNAQIEDIRNLLQDVSRQITVFGEASNSLFDVSTFEQLTDFTQRMTDAYQRAFQQTQQFVNAVGDMADQVGEAAEGSSESSRTAQQIAEQNAETIRDLRVQYQETVKAFGNAEELAKNFFKNVGGHAAANVSDVVSNLYNAVKSQDLNSVEQILDSDNVQGLSFASQQVAQIINELNNIPDEETSLDAHLATMSEMQKFANSINESQSQVINKFQTLLQETGNSEILERIIAQLKEEQAKFNDKVQQTLENSRNKVNGLIDIATNQNRQSIENVNVAGTDEYNQANLDIAGMFAKQSHSTMASSQTDLANALRQMTAGDLEQSRVAIPGIYRVFSGNFLNNRSKFKEDIRHAQRANIHADRSLSDVQKNLNELIKNKDTESSKKMLDNLAQSVEANALAHVSGLKNINLHRGQYKLLNENDKGMLDSFLKSSDNAAMALRDAISAIEAIDPQSKSLERLKSINEELTSTTENIKDIRDDSFDVKDLANGAMSSVKKAHGLLIGGMGLMGLGMLAPTIGNLTKIISGGFEAEKRSGQYRYELAKSDIAMGANIDVNRNMFYVDDMAKEYYGASQGDIGWEKVKDYVINMRKNVGGHYGDSPVQAKADMDKLSEYTFGIAQQYGLNDNDVSSFMKTYFKDLGHSAEQAGYSLVQMARAAQSAGMPVAAYINSLTNMMSSLREYGVTGEKVQQFMRDMTSRGMRTEEAQGLLSDTAKAGRNMGFNDWAASGFYGMMAGQGGDIWNNIASGMMPVKSDGTPNKEYFSMMTQRLFAEAGLMGAIGGGPGSALGTGLMMDALSKRGYSQTSVSMLGDAYRHGDMSLFEKLLQQAEEEKEDSEEGLRKAMAEAKDKIKASGTQQSEIVKAQVQVALAEKRLGEVIHNELQEPLQGLREGFGKLLDGFVSSVEILIREIKKFAASDTGKAIGNFVGNMSPEGLIGAAIGAPIAAALGWKGLKVGGELVKYGITRNPAGMSTAANVARTLPGPLKALGALALIGGGTYAYNTVPETQFYKDVTESIGGLYEGLKEHFASGDVKAQVVPKDEAKKVEKSAETKYVQEQTERQAQSHEDKINEDKAFEDNLEYYNNMSEQDKRTIEEAFASGGQDALNKEIENIRKNNEDSSETNKNAQKTLADIQKEDLERLNRETEREFERNHDGMSNYAVAGGTAAIAAMAGYMGNRSNRDNSSVTPTTGLTPEEEQRKRREETNKRMEKERHAMDSANAKYEQRQNEIRQRYAQEEARVRNDINSRYVAEGRQAVGDKRTIVSGRNAQSAIDNLVQRDLKDARAQMDKDLAEAKEGYEKQRKSIMQQHAPSTSSSTASAAENAAKQSWAKGKLTNMKNVAKVSGPASLGLSAVMAGAEEFMDWQENPDKFTAGERFARFGITAGTEAAGMVVGGALGSLLGPVGTIAGGMAGAYGGRMLGDAMKKYFKISDEDGKRMGDSYLDASKWASGKYTDDTNSLINSNDKTAQVTKEKMEEHGVKMESLTKDQQAYIDKLFNELKALGYSDITAASIAGSVGGQYAEKVAAAAEEKWNGENGYDGYYYRQQAADELAKQYRDKAQAKTGMGSAYDEDASKAQMWEWTSLWAKDKQNGNETGLNQIRDQMLGRVEYDKVTGKISDKRHDSNSEADRKYRDIHSWLGTAGQVNGKEINRPNSQQKTFNIENADWRKANNISDEQAKPILDMINVGEIKRTGAWGAPEGERTLDISQVERTVSSYTNKGGSLREEGIQNLKTKEDRSENGINPGGSDKPQKDDNNNGTDDNIDKTAGNAAKIQYNKLGLGSPGSGEGKYWVRQHGGVSTEGMKDQTLGAMDMLGQWFQQKTGQRLVMTSGTNGNHQSNGSSTGHDAGWKIDVNDWGGPDGLQGGYLVTESGQKGTLVDEFTRYGQSLGLGMNWEGDHIDVSAVGEQWADANGNALSSPINYGGFETPNANAPDVSNLPEGGSTPSSGAGSSDLKNNPDSMNQLAKSTMDIYDSKLKDLGLTSSDAFRDKYAAGRLIMDGTTASFRDRDVYMTPQGLRNRLALSSGARETSLMGYNTKGYFSWDEESKTYKQYDTSGVKMEDKRLKDLEDKFYKGKKGEITYLDGAKEKIDYQNKAVTDTTAWQQESTKRYETPINERLEQDIKNDMDEKHSVNISMNVIGGGVTKQQVIQFIRNTLIDKEEQDSQHYRRAANEASLQQHEREKRISGHE